MSSGTRHCESAAEQLAALYAPVREDLEQVESILRGELHSEFPFVDRLVQHGFQLGGKRLRPALLLLTAQACGAVRDEHRVLAAVMELVHTATLIHDDVLDEALVRRHLETVNARWGNEASVLLGDYLFARAVCLAASLEDTWVCRAIAETTRVVCEGELRQVGTRGHFDLPEAEYLDIVRAKTAELCACCCRLGARFAGAGEAVQDAVARYGSHLGIAFQIVDDVLDVRGKEAVVGKSLGTDLMKQKPTLPVIRLLNQAAVEERETLAEILRGAENHKAEVLAPWFERYDAIAYSQQKAALYVRRAAAELEGLAPSPARDCLARLADFVIRRDQ